MEILQELKEYKENLAKLKYWQYEVEKKENIAKYGSGTNFNDIKIQVSKYNSFENKVIDLLEAEEKRKELIIKTFRKSQELGDILYKYCKNAFDMNLIYQFFFKI